jgi:hypothetical protein
VEFGSPDGRVVLVEEPLGIVLPDAGGIVPLLVNPEGTKAVFDKHDPRINVNSVVEATEDAEEGRLDSELT